MANKQWGSSYISLNPTYSGGDASLYFPKEYTISGKWGNFTTFSNPVANEFKYYNQEFTQPTTVFLSESQVNKIIQSEFVLQGMNNLYNSVKFIASSECLNQTMIIEWTQTYGIDSIYSFSQPMQYMV